MLTFQLSIRVYLHAPNFLSFLSEAMVDYFFASSLKTSLEETYQVGDPCSRYGIIFTRMLSIIIVSLILCIKLYRMY